VVNLRKTDAGDHRRSLFAKCRVAGNNVWTGFGGICETNNDGDPVVLYDHLADRWMISQFAIGRDGHQCITVSTTSDPTGSYFRATSSLRKAPERLPEIRRLAGWLLHDGQRVRAPASSLPLS
jgi:hypothetical protein